MTLADLRINEYGVIISLDSPNRRNMIRLLEMGVTPRYKSKKNKGSSF